MEQNAKYSVVVYFFILDTKISMTTWLEKQVQGNSWYRLGSLFDQADVVSRDEIEDNHDIIELSREALQDSPAAAFCGEYCVTTPNATLSFVLGDSDTLSSDSWFLVRIGRDFLSEIFLFNV